MKENSTFKDTTIHDYLPDLYELYPEIPKLDIKRIVEFGWRLIYIAILFGCDVSIVSTTHKFWFYIGYLCKDPFRHLNYYKKKLIIKMKFFYRRFKPNLGNIYYVGISQEEYETFFKKTGRKRVKLKLNNKTSFKFKDACIVYNTANCYIIKFEHLLDRGFSFYSENLEIKNPEVVLFKSSNTFKDILVTNNDYEFI